MRMIQNIRVAPLAAALAATLGVLEVPEQRVAVGVREAERRNSRTCLVRPHARRNEGPASRAQRRRDGAVGLG